MEQLIKISQDPIPFEQHSLSHTAVLSGANLLMSQLPQRPSTPTVKSLLQKTTPSCRGRNKEQLPRERRPQLFPLLQGQFQSALTAFWALKINAPPDHPAILQLPFSMSKTVQTQKHISVRQLFRTCSEEKNSFPCKKRAATCSKAAAHLHAMSQTTGTMNSLKNLAG